jgi:SM-20-related protein
VYYLNQTWGKSDGGELALYAPKDKQDDPIRLIPPLFNQCVIFLSDSFPHEVLLSHKDRFSIAGWYRINNNGQNIVDPSS